MPVILVLLWLVSLVLTSPQAGAADAPRAVGGVVDLTGWDFDRYGAVDLVGEWGFAPGGDATQAFSGHPVGFIRTPGPWNTVVENLPAEGRAVMSLTIRLPERRPPLAIAVPDVNSAYRLHVDGAPARAVGRVGHDRASELPVQERQLVPLPTGSNPVQLVFEISNFHHFEGGLGRAVRLGNGERLADEEMRRKAVPLAAFGALVIVALLMVTFYLGGKRQAVTLVFAAFVALIAWRTFAAGQLYTLIGHDLRADLWYLLPAYLTLYVFPGIHLGFLRSMFPDEVPRRLVLPFYWVSGAMIALVLLAPPSVFTRFRDPFQVLVLAVPAIGLVLLARAMARRRRGAVWVFAGSLVLAVTVVNDSLHYQRIIETTDLVPLGFAALAVAYCAAVALRLFHAEREASRRLAVLNRELESKVAERTASLLDAKAAAERASQAKSDFLAVMSHEIRTPLHGWAGLTELLEGTELDERQRQYVGLLRHTAEHLSKLIGDILDMSRIEAGRLELDHVVFRPVDLVAELAAIGRSQVVAKGLAFELDLGEGLPEAVCGDPGAMRQVVLNLLHNACKFTEQGCVRLSVAPASGGGLFVAVSDTGRGIPPDRQADIFATFTQLDASTRRQHGGSGLGLAICRRLVELMGGRIGVDSKLGAGTTIWFEVPLPAAAAPVSPQGADPVLPSGRRILFADDAELNRLVMREFLAGTGCVLDEASDGNEALAKVAVTPYDLVVLDLRMPGMDGFQAARAIRARECDLGLAPVPIAALSAGASAADRRDAVEAGITTFLAKPIDRIGLLAALSRLLGPEPASEPLPPPPDVPAGLEALMPAFVAEMAKDVVLLREIGAADRTLLAEQAHATRGKCGMFGEEMLFALLTRLEDGAGSLPEDEVRSILAQFAERAAQLAQYPTIATAPP